MTKFIASIVLAASVLAGVSAANAAPKADFAASFFAKLATNGN
jgi:hypothetical protein